MSEPAKKDKGYTWEWDYTWKWKKGDAYGCALVSLGMAINIVALYLAFTL